MASLDNVQEVLTHIKKSLKDNKIESSKTKLAKLSRSLLIASGILFFTGLIIFLPYYVKNDIYGSYKEKIFTLMIWPLLVSQLLAAISLLLHIVDGLKFIKSSIKNPTSPFFELVIKNSSSDIEIVNYLRTKKSEDLKFALLEISSEREAFFNRTAFLAGTITNIGFLPALVTYLVALKQLNLFDEIKNFPPTGYSGFLFLIPIFYLMGAYGKSLDTLLKRGASLLEFVILEKEKSERKKFSQKFER